MCERTTLPLPKGATTWYSLSLTLTFVYLPLFLRSADGLLSDDDLREVENLLLANPQAGALIAGSGGVRKLRVAFPGQGKRGSGRIIYLYVSVKDTVYFILAYAKTQQENITPEQKKQIRQLVRQLEKE